MTREQALRKVRACLRLGASANPHEAAAALRQARSLMERYGLTQAETEGCRFEDAATRQRGAQLPVSIARLAGIVAEGFRCRMLIVRLQCGRSGSTAVRFYGMNSDATVAAYAFTVLRRQLDSDRQRYARIRLKPICSESMRMARLERFAEGWVYAIEDLFPKANTSDTHIVLIDAQIRADHGQSIQTMCGRDVVGKRRMRRDWMDDACGFAMGQGARLHGALASSSMSRPGLALEQLP